MADWKRGARAGVVAGLIHSMVLDIMIFAVGPFLLSELLPALVALFGFGTSVLLAVVAVIGGMVAGLMLGLVYAACYDVLPGSSLTKGWMIGLILWALELAFSFTFVGVAPYVLTLFIAAVFIYGGFLGFVWDRLKWEE